jgi:protein gp37
VGARRHVAAKAPPLTHTLFLERLSQRDTVCKNCYAEGMVKRLQAMGTPGYENWFALKMLPLRLEDPVKRRKPTTYFANSMSDLFHERIPDEYASIPKCIAQTFLSTQSHAKATLDFRPGMHRCLTGCMCEK